MESKFHQKKQGLIEYNSELTLTSQFSSILNVSPLEHYIIISLIYINLFARRAVSFILIYGTNNKLSKFKIVNESDAKNSKETFAVVDVLKVCCSSSKDVETTSSNRLGSVFQHVINLETGPASLASFREAIVDSEAAQSTQLIYE